MAVLSSPNPMVHVDGDLKPWIDKIVDDESWQGNLTDDERSSLLYWAIDFMVRAVNLRKSLAAAYGHVVAMLKWWNGADLAEP